MFLSDDCQNFDIPEYRVQTSACLQRHPEGWKETVSASTKKLLSFP
jgi:hypothetical protein